MQFAKRIEKIPTYLFAEINRKREELVAKGVDIINIGVEDPDRPTPTHIVQAMQEAIEDPSNHNYPPYQGTKDYREADVEWMERWFEIEGLDPDRDIISSIGSKEAIHNTFLAFIEPGDYSLIPDPGYPVYRTSTIFAGGEPYTMPLKAENNFLPDLKAIPKEVALEFHSLSKSYNMTDWWVGFFVGNAIAIQGLKQVKTNVDSGVFKAIQRAAIAGFKTTQEELQEITSVYQNRQNIIVAGLKSLGWLIEAPKATLYIWVPVPQGYSSTEEFVTLLLNKCGIIVPPGNGYGESGERFFRIALTVPD